MSDVSKIGDDLLSALRKAVSIVGPIEVKDLEKIVSASNRLQGSLNSYDRRAQSLLSSMPSPKEVSKDKKDKLDEVIKSRYPQSKGYTDKMYKMVVLRVLHKLNPFFKHKTDTEEKKINYSVQALTVFKLISNVILSSTNQLVRTSGGIEHRNKVKDSSGTDELDSELSSTIDELESEVRPIPVTDKHQKQTGINLKRKLMRSIPTGKASSDAEYRDALAKFNQIIEDAKTSVRTHKKSISSVVAGADEHTFRIISNSARAINDLAKVYELAATSARENMAPGAYAACKSFSGALLEVTQAVIDSSARNRASKAMESKRETAMDKYFETTNKIETSE